MGEKTAAVAREYIPAPDNQPPLLPDLPGNKEEAGDAGLFFVLAATN
jgi:hypothetical protein